MKPRRSWFAIVLAVFVVSCGKEASEREEPSTPQPRSKEPPPRSEREEIQLKCDARTEAPKDFAGRERLFDQARRLGLRCALVEPEWADVTLPEVTGPGVEPTSEGLPMIVVSTSEMGVAGTRTTSVHDVLTRHLDTGEAVRKMMRELRIPCDPVRMYVDRSTSWELLANALLAAAGRGCRDFAMIARRGSELVSVPIHVYGHDRMERGFGLVPNGKSVALWSWSGSKPMAVIENRKRAELARMLTDLVERKFGSGAREPEDMRIQISVPDNLMVSDLLDLMSYVRKSSDGRDLFPDVELPIDDDGD
jgi:hypothetical protein